MLHLLSTCEATSLWLLFLWIPYQCAECSFLLLLIQVQEKKVKKISDMNIDPSRAVGNGSVASSSVSSSPKQCSANGGYADRSLNCLSNDLSFPPGGFSSLRLPVVVVLKLYMPCMFSCLWNVKYVYVHYILFISQAF